MKLSYLEIKNKCFFRSPGFVTMSMSVLLIEVAAILLSGEIASYALQIIMFLPTAVCMLYHLVNYQEDISGMMRIEKVYYSAFEIGMSEFYHFSVLAFIYYIQLLVLVLGLGHKYVSGDAVKYVFMGLVMWLYTECLYLIGEIVFLLIKNRALGLLSIVFAAYIPPFFNLYKYSYLWEIRRLFIWSGMDARVKSVTGEAVDFGVGTAGRSMDIRELCTCFFGTLFIYAVITVVKTIKYKEWRK